MYITGGAAQALAWLLATPGASRVVVEAAVPYSREATANLLLRTRRGGGASSSSSTPTPSVDTVTAVTAETAMRLAEAAYRRAAQLTPLGRPCVGLGATSALASEPPKRGAHRAHVAAHIGGTGRTIVATLELAKGARTRWEEDAVAGKLLLRVLARALSEAAAGGGEVASAAGAAEAGDLDLGLLLQQQQNNTNSDILTERALSPLHPSSEPPPQSQLPPRAALAALLAGHARCVEFSPDGRVCAVDGPRGGGASVSGAAPPVVYLSGSFNPLHAGHEGLLLAAQQAVAAAIAGDGNNSTPSSLPSGCFELSLGNADKGLLPLEEAERRVRQFAQRGLPLLVTAEAPLFTQKAALLPGAWFAVGYDTAARLVQARYYDDGREGDGGVGQMALQFERLRAAGCRFLVAGRAESGGGGGGGGEAGEKRFLTLADVPIAPGLRDLFVDIPEQAFRNDVSSTELRAKGMGL